MTYVSAGMPPFYVVHGDADALVPFGQSELLVAALRNIGADVVFRVVKGGGHGGGVFDGDEMVAEVRAFFDRHLAAGTPS